MFLHWSFFTLTIGLTVFRLLLVSAVNAALAIYSKLGGEYAHSIRWARQGGVQLMVTALYNSRKHLRRSTTFAMVVTIIASLTASFADKGAALAIHPFSRPTNASYTVAVTTQFSLIGSRHVFSGWSTAMPYGANITEAMSSFISNAKNIPDAVDGRLYTPRTSKYEVACDRMDLYLFSGIKTGISLPNGGCTSAVLKFLGIFSVNTTAAQVFNVSSGRWSIAMPGISTMPVTEISVSAAIALDDEPCGTADLVDSLSSVTGLGLTSTPRTSTVKCVLQNGELRVLSTSAVRFMVPNVTLFRDVSNSVFEEYDDLLQAMEFSINNATFQSNSTFFMEVKTSNATIDAVGCFSTKDLRQQATYLTCIYSTTNTFTTNQQTINPLITAARGQSLPPPANFSTSMTIRHLPLSYNRMARPLSISALRRATANATHYLASLGQNFYTDWDAAKLYVIYDTTDLEQGFEIPRGLFITMAVLAAASLLLWFFTGLLLGNLYTGTLYRVIAAEIAVRTENSAPMLMRSKVNPVEFEGYLLIPDDGLHELDNISNNDDNDNDKNDDNDNDKNDDTGNGNDEDKNNDRNDNSNNHSNKTPLPESLKRD